MSLLITGRDTQFVPVTSRRLCCCTAGFFRRTKCYANFSFLWRFWGSTFYVKWTGAYFKWGQIYRDRTSRVTTCHWSQQAGLLDEPVPRSVHFPLLERDIYKDIGSREWGVCVCVCVLWGWVGELRLGLGLGNGKIIAFDSKLGYGLCVYTFVFMWYMGRIL